MTINDFDENVQSEIKSLYSGGRFPHALLIDGGDEAERESLAQFLAKKIVCQNRDSSPCNMCECCRKADENIHPDIIKITRPDDKKFFVKADVRAVTENAYLTPNDADVKVYILSELQYMNEESQNVLLKILEEPPTYTAFILTAKTANAVIGTVLSRVQRLRISGEDNSQYSEKALDVVKNIANALSSAYEFDLVAAVSPLDGNKTLTAEVLTLLEAFFRDAAVKKSGGKMLVPMLSDESEKVGASFSTQRLLSMYETVGTLLRSTDNYPNYTLLSATLCARLKDYK